ncbi:MAG: membrane protein FxsA [Gemmatimonadota bacterium]|jgi:UPF0716 protein FxsA
MNILGRLALFFIVVPLLELVLLIRIGEWIGLWPTLGLVVTTGVLGAALARAEGLRVLYQFQRELASGKLPGQALLDGISVLIGGAFLLTPGILTDLTGFALLFPVTRRWIQKAARRRLEHGLEQGTIRVVTMGAGGLGGGGFGFGGGSAPRGPGADRQHGVDEDGAAEGRLDPSKGIVVEPGEPNER